MQSKRIEFLSVGGYGYSGGTALLDLVREMDNYCEIGTEFRLLKDPYGIMDLEKQLTANWRDQLNADVAIKDFIWLAENLYRKPKKYSKIGKNYQDQISLNFLEYSYEYVGNLSEYSYQGNWHLLRYKESLLLQLFNKVRRKINSEKLKTIYYAKPSEEKFLHETKFYIEKMFLELCKNKEKANVLLHNAIPTYNPQKTLKYFEAIKMIVVDRDPRDIYVDVINKKATAFLGDKLINDRDVDKFVENYKSRRENQKEFLQDDRILHLRFEKLVLDYENTINEITGFLGLDESNHVQKGIRFAPEKSKNNIGLWKNYDGKEEIDFIYKHLKEFCYDS